MKIIESYLTNNLCYKRNQHINPTKIMLHSTACPGAPAQNFVKSWNTETPNGSKVCVHAFLNPDEVYQTLPWNMRGWHCGGTGNDVAIGFEICEPYTYTDEAYFKKVKQTALELCEYLCKEFGISPDNVTSHCEGYRKYGKSFASNHSDLDHWWKKYFGYTMDDFREELRKMMTVPNQEKLDFLGITKFHNAGFKGDGIIIASRENNTTTHGAMVEEVIKQVAPGATILLKENYQKGTSADIYTTSYFSVSDNYARHKKTSQELYDSNVFLCCAVGNEGESSQSGLSKQECWTSIGACDLVNGVPKRMHYSSITNDIDFMSLTNFDTSLGKSTGTSCASPVFASMCALVQDLAYVKVGRLLTNQELLRFAKDNCIDMFEEGKDDHSGYGLFVLPDPWSIDFDKYIVEEEFDNGEKRSKGI